MRKNGDLAYQLGDGGVVTDEKERIRVDRLSYQAVLTALSLGEKRFRGQTLALDGTASFKRRRRRWRPRCGSTSSSTTMIWRKIALV